MSGRDLTSPHTGEKRRLTLKGASRCLTNLWHSNFFLQSSVIILPDCGMQRKLLLDLLANVSGGHLPPCGAPRCTKDSPAMPTAVEKPALTARYLGQNTPWTSLMPSTLDNNNSTAESIGTAQPVLSVLPGAYLELWAPRGSEQRKSAQDKLNIFPFLNP